MVWVIHVNDVGAKWLNGWVSLGQRLPWFGTWMSEMLKIGRCWLRNEKIKQINYRGVNCFWCTRIFACQQSTHIRAMLRQSSLTQQQHHHRHHAYENNPFIRNIVGCMLIRRWFCIRWQCENNQITQNDFVNRGDAIQTLQMCMFNLNSIQGIEHFRNLTELIIIAQDITHMDDCLGECAALRKLWVCETKVRTIQGLSECKILTHLFLFVETFECGCWRLPLLFPDTKIKSPPSKDSTLWAAWKSCR